MLGLPPHSGPYSIPTMPNLPSFVELMDTLGIDNHATVPESQSPKSAHSRSSSNSSSASSPQLFAYSSPPRLAHKAQSIPSFRELEPDRRNGLNRHRVARYSPYAFGHVSSRQFKYSDSGLVLTVAI